MFLKRRTISQDASLNTIEAPWQGCIAVCTKCSKKVRAMDGDKTRLRVALKALITLKGIKKQVRAVDCSCMDICPENKITVAHFTERGVHVINAGPAVTAQQILDEFGLG